MANTPGQLVSSGKACLRDDPAPSAKSSPGHHEALAVDRDAILEPAGIGIGADEQEQMAQRARVRLAGLRSRNIAPVRPLTPSPSKPTISVRVCSVTFGSALMRSMRYCDIDASSPSPAHHEMQMLHLRREEHDGLTGRVAAADQRHLLALAELRLDGRGPIGDPCAFELGEV